MMEVDAGKIIALAESAERRAQQIHLKYLKIEQLRKEALARYANITSTRHELEARNLLNDFFYWSGKATSYRGIIAMMELATVVEDELDAEGSCP